MDKAITGAFPDQFGAIEVVCQLVAVHVALAFHFYYGALGQHGNTMHVVVVQGFGVGLDEPVLLVELLCMCAGRPVATARDTCWDASK